MNIYFIGMMIAMAVFVIIGFFVSRRIRSAEDFYVAGRQAPVLLIAGSLIASYASTGMFMGDAGTFYDGGFSGMIILSGMQSAGYIIGAVFFGRYLRRSRTITIPEFFGSRFDSPAVKVIATVTAIATMTVYLLSIIQGVGTLMELVTGVDYKICIVIAMVVFTLISVTSGSSGVLITDTLMAAVFTGALVIGIGFIAKNTGGWFTSVETVAADPDLSALLSWGGKPGALYDTGIENVIWGVNYGIVWMSVCMVGPWQASRYQMAKDEHTVVRSAYWTGLFIFLLEFLTGMAAIMVHNADPDFTQPSHVLVWAAMHLMPKLLGVVLLTGILAAGISSATTFQTLVGTLFANDVLGGRLQRAGLSEEETQRRSIAIGRTVMVVVAVLVTGLALFNPPQIFVIMMFGGTIIASSWMPVAVASTFSKRITKVGAVAGMIAGFVCNFFVKLYLTFAGISLPAWLDTSIIGMVACVIAMVIGSALTQVTEEEKAARARMFVMPEIERDPAEIKKTLGYTRIAMGIGVLFAAILIVLWIVPYYIGTGRL